MKTLPYVRAIAVPHGKVFDHEGTPTAQFNHFLRKLAHMAGGFTVTDQKGGWIMQDGTLCQESILRVEVLCDDDAVGEVSTTMKLFAAWLLATGEEAVLYMAGDLAFLFEQSDRSTLLNGLVT